MQHQKVFIVDDDEESRESINSILRSVGYSVQLFASGAEFLESLDEDVEGCLILDVRMPGPSGLEVQRRLADRGISIPIIFITGYGDIAMAVQAMKANAVEFLTKPMRDQDLLDAIEVAMRRNIKLRDREHARSDALHRIGTLTPRERQVFFLLCEGRLTKQIAPELGLSQATVKVHRRNIMQKLGVLSIAEMIILHAETLEN